MPKPKAVEPKTSVLHSCKKKKKVIPIQTRSKCTLSVSPKLRYWEYMLYVLGENIAMESIRVGSCLMDRSRGAQINVEFRESSVRWSLATGIIQKRSNCLRSLAYDTKLVKVQ